MQQSIVKSLPLVVGLSLTILFSILLHDRTATLAVDEAQLVPSEEKNANAREAHYLLRVLLAWRDLWTAALSGVFVLLFTLVQRITSDLARHARSITGFDITLLIVIVAAAVGMILVFLGINKVGLQIFKRKRNYWLMFLLCVVPWYLASLVVLLAD